MSSEIYKLENVTREYRDAGVVALDGATLAITEGEFVAVAGRSGSGKSTLLDLLGALDRPSSGRVSYRGEDLGSMPRLDRIRQKEFGFVFQLHHLIPILTLRENVEIPMYGTGISVAGRKKRASELLEAVGLAHRADFLPVRVSGGERQRTALARALANSPRVIIADEPTGNVDLETADEMLEYLERLRAEKNVTIIVATHDPGIESRADRVIRLSEGKIVSGSGAP